MKSCKAVHWWRQAGLWVVAMCLAGGAQGQVASEFSAGLSSGARPTNITSGPDGNLWFSEGGKNRIGRITPQGVVTEFSAGAKPDDYAALSGIAAGPDGNLWFTDTYGNRIVRITQGGGVTEFNTDLAPTAGSASIVAGPDGNMWFAGVYGIGRISTAGVVTEFRAGISNDGLASGITVGPDGNLWFTEPFGNRIGRITTAGAVTEFSVGISAGAWPFAIAAGSDGNLWFTENRGNRIGRITTTGEITEFSVGISADAEPLSIVAGPDGNLWFSENYGGIGRITPAGVVTEFNAGITPDAYPWGIAVGADGNLWFTEYFGNAIGRLKPPAPPSAPVCTLIALPNFIGVNGRTKLQASCSPAATSYTWTNTGFGARTASGTVLPMLTTIYSVVGSNSVGSGNTATTAVIVGTSVVSQKDVRTYVPAASLGDGYVSYLRVINTGSVATPVLVAMINATTGAVSTSAQLTPSLAPGAATTFSAQQIESALGLSLTANDRPRIRISGVLSPVEVQSLLLQPGGVFNELSGASSGASVAVSTYVPAAAASSGYISYLRVANTGSSASTIIVARIDPVTGVTGAAGILNTALPAGAAVTYSATQIEAALGISLAANDRPRISVEAIGSTLDVQSLLIQPGGAFTEISSSQSGATIDVRSYVPAAASGYTSFLRVINTSATATPITATLMDDATGLALGSGTIASSLAANGALTLSSSQLEAAMGIKVSAFSRPRIRVTTPSGMLTLQTQSFLLQPGGAYNEISNALSGTTVNVRTHIPAVDAAAGYVSYVRVINTTASATPITVALIDGVTGVVGAVRTLLASLPGGAAQTFGSTQIEAVLGAAVPSGTRPRLQISGNVVLDVQSFLTQPGGAFTEMSGGQ